MTIFYFFSDKNFKYIQSRVLFGDAMVEVTCKSGYMDLLNAYPLLKTDLPRKNPKFTFLVTQMGKISLWEADLEEVSKSAEMSVDDTVELFKELINSY